MASVPISFDYKGKHFEGELSQVYGAQVWHLMIDSRYYGMLMYTTQWVFHNPKNEMKELVGVFGEHVMDHNNKSASC